MRAAVETALLVALLLDAPPAPLPLAAAAALVALRPLRPPSRAHARTEDIRCELVMGEAKGKARTD